MANGLFSSDDSYKEMIAQYGKADGVLALAFYALLLLINYSAGALVIKRNIYLGIPVNLSIIALCIAIVRARRQSLASVGVTLNNARKALLSGLLFGTILALVQSIIPSILAGRRVIPFWQALYNIFYYFIVIALTEEIVFTGFIQTRIYGLIKRDFTAILVTGILFYLMHLPFLAQVSGMRFELGKMTGMVALHFWKNYLYRKYNSLVGPTVMHGVIDWGGFLLK